MIRFFISSTFQDMSAERELLHKRVVPRLNEYAKTIGEIVEICDLRWGIDTSDIDEEEKLLQIVNTCLEAIDECNGGVIAFLGERYGTCLENQEQVKEQLEKRQVFLADYGISITQIEIEYGIIARKECPSLCYFRKTEGRDCEKSKNQTQLKERLEKAGTSLKCKDYKAKITPQKEIVLDLDALEELLYEDMKAIVDEKAKQEKAANWIEEELILSKYFQKKIRCEVWEEQHFVKKL